MIIMMLIKILILFLAIYFQLVIFAFQHFELAFQCQIFGISLKFFLLQLLHFLVELPCLCSNRFDISIHQCIFNKLFVFESQIQRIKSFVELLRIVYGVKLIYDRIQNLWGLRGRNLEYFYPATVF